MREIVLDTETTGLRAHDGDRLIEIGCVELINRKRGASFHTYINPEREVSQDAYNVHGLSSEFLRDKPTFKQIEADFMNFLSDSTLIIHNAAFDIGFINMELTLLKKNILPMHRVIDTLAIARKKFPKAPANLDALCKKFGISLENRTKHGALIDAELLSLVYLSLLDGDQATMSFEHMRSQSNNLKYISKIFPYRPAKVSHDQEARHNEFLQKIPNSIWNAIKSTS